MRVNKLGNTGINLSTIGLGTWAIGGGDYQYGWGTQEDKNSIATIRRSLELGINWLDTAPVYGLGHAEKVVGQAIKGVRNKVIISTKCGFRWNHSKEIFSNLKKESIRSEVEESLNRLNIDTIDLYQIHKPITGEIEEAWETLAALAKEGKIRSAGVSNFSLEELKRIQSIYPVAFIQPGYNMLEPSIEEEILDYCTANHIGVIAFSPMYSGLLTGKFTKEKVKSLPADDWRRSLNPYFQEPYLEVILQLLEKLRPIADRNSKTLAQLAIAWVLRRPEVTSAIVGARQPSQIEQTVPAGDWILTEQDKKELDTILKYHHALLKKFDEHQ